MTAFTLLVIFAACFLTGQRLGPAIRGTTISGLKFAACFWAAVGGLLLGLLLAALFNVFGSGVGLLGGALFGVATSLLGVGLGYLRTR